MSEKMKEEKDTDEDDVDKEETAIAIPHIATVSDASTNSNAAAVRNVSADPDVSASPEVDDVEAVEDAEADMEDAEDSDDEELDDAVPAHLRYFEAEESSSSSDGSAWEAQWKERGLYHRPPYAWHVSTATRKREFGSGAAAKPGGLQFAHNARGSRHFAERLKLLSVLEGHTGCVNCLGFNDAGTFLASGSDDLNIRIWDWGARTCLRTFDSGHTMNVFQSRFLGGSGDCHIVSCARDGQVRIARLSTSGEVRETRKLAQHRDSAHKLALQPDTPHQLLSCGEDGYVYDIDLRSPDPNRLLVANDDENRPIALYSVHSHPTQSQYFAVAGRDPNVRLYDRRYVKDWKKESSPLHLYCPLSLRRNGSGGLRHDITCAVFNHDGTEIVASYNDENAYLFNVETEETLQCYEGHRNSQTVKGINFWGSGSEFVISGSDCGHAFVWNKKTAAILTAIHADMVRTILSGAQAASLSSPSVTADTPLSGKRRRRLSLPPYTLIW